MATKANITIDQATTQANIRIDQGADFSVDIALTSSTDSPTNLTNYTVAATIKKTHTSTTSVSFTTAITSPATGGLITLSLTNVQTSNLSAGRYVYDVEITDTVPSPDEITRVLEGQVEVTPSVT
jgi:Tfp pilus assembly protein PilV